MNLFTKQKQTHRHRKQTMGATGDSGEWEEIKQEFEINMYTLLCIKQVSNKDLLYSTENYV